MKKIILLIMILVVVLSAVAGISVVGVYVWASKDLPDIRKVSDWNPPLVTTVYTRKNNVLGYLYREKRFLAPLKEMPKHLIQAFLAAEDKTFYEHQGVDFKAIFRAFLKNLQAGGKKQGGSTITQQIVKRLLLSSERSYERKLREAILAYRLDNYLTKDEILLIYLNQIFLGARSYGVEAAARTYFGKHVGALTLAESAVLAGLPPAPSAYNPYRHPEIAKKRQLYVLDRMLEMNWITQEAFDQAVNEELEYKSMADVSWKQGAYYLEEVRRWLVDYLSEKNMDRLGIKLDRYGEDAAYEYGLHVYTALDMEHQLAAEKALKDGLEASTKRRGWRGPLKKLTPDEYQAFLDKETVPIDMLEPGRWVKALVTNVSKAGADVKIGPFEGYISVKTMHWCRKIDPSKATEQVASIKDAHRVVAPGDVVWAAIMSPADEQKFDGKKKKTKDEVEPDTTSIVKTEDGKLKLALKQKPKVQGALVSVEPDSGEVRALVGGYNFDDSQFNRATQAYRQPGSAFKPIVYSTAMDNGFTPASVVNDVPIVIPYGKKVWRPGNFSGKFYGPTLLRTALAKSRNIVTIRVAQRIGIKKVIERAKLLGLEPDFPPYLPICLGAVSVTPINLCQAYTAFARGGTTIKPRLVLSIKGPWGEDFYTSEPEIKEGISPQNAFIMDALLQGVVQAGTATKAKKLGRAVAGKTGTTNEERDAWFMGFTPYLLTGVYVGFDQSRPMGKYETGGRAALPIWLQYRMAIEKEYPEQEFPEPEGIVYSRVTFADRQKDGSLKEGTYYLPFMKGTQPGVYMAEGMNIMDGGMEDADESSAMGPNKVEPEGKEEDLFKQLF